MRTPLSLLGLLTAGLLLAPASADAKAPRRKRARMQTAACRGVDIDAMSREDALWLLVTQERHSRLVRCSLRTFSPDGSGNRMTAVFSGGETLEITTSDPLSVSRLRLRGAVPEAEAARLESLADRALTEVADHGGGPEPSTFWASLKQRAAGSMKLDEGTDGPSGQRVRGLLRPGATSFMTSFLVTRSGRVRLFQTVTMPEKLDSLRWVKDER